MSSFETPLLQIAHSALDVAATRQRAIAENMANVDTPGYHTRDVDFSAELSRQLREINAPQRMETISRSVPGMVERPDGNNVNVEREGLLLADTQLKFDLAVQIVRSEFKRMQMAIQEP